MTTREFLAYPTPGESGKMTVAFPAIEPIRRGFTRGLCFSCARKGRIRRFITHVVWQGMTDQCLGTYCPLCAAEVFEAYEAIQSLPSARERQRR